MYQNNFVCLYIALQPILFRLFLFTHSTWSFFIIFLLKKILIYGIIKRLKSNLRCFNRTKSNPLIQIFDIFTRGTIMAKLKIAVLFGGASKDHDVSLKSAYSVLNGLSPSKYEIIPIGITKAGRWLYYPGSYEAVADGSWESDPDCCPAIISPDYVHHGIMKFFGNDDVSGQRVDVVFSLLHGKYGESGRIQSLCKLAGISHAVLEVLSLVLAFTNQAEKKGFVVRDSSYHSSTFCSVRKATSCFCKRSLCPRYLSSEMTLFSSLGSFLRS